MNLEGHTAIVTGGASGLGAATARLLAGKGMRVGIVDLDAQAAEQMSNEIDGAYAACDVADADAAVEALARLEWAIGSPRLLVHCAGIGTAARIVGRDGPMDLAAFERVVRVNLIGTFNMMRLVATAMSTLDPLDQDERGVIVTTASVAAFEGQLGQAAYAASKGGIASMTLPAAREFARFGIRVVSIAPGLFETPLLGELPDEARRGLSSAIPFPSRLGRPEEFASLAAAIAENPYLNGEVIRLDGALRMSPR